MAVSMNAGYMRSDYMISDAAIPMRMEELEQLEQSAKFSEILGEFGNASSKEAYSVPAEESATAAVEDTNAAMEAPQLAGGEGDSKTSVIISKAELRSLAKAVIDGEIKLSELPEELVSDVLLMVIAMMMMGIPEDEIPALQADHTITVTEAEMQTMSEYAALVVAPKLNAESSQQVSEGNAAFEIPEELMAEVQSVVNKIVDAQNEVSVDADVQQLTDKTAKTVAIEPTGYESGTDLIADNVQNVETHSNTVQQGGAAQKMTQAISAEQVKLDQEFEQLRRIISEVTVKKPEAQQNIQQTYTSQTLGTDDAAKGRMISKSDELAILKNAAKPVEIDLNAVVEAKADTAVDVNVDTSSENGTQAEADLNGQAAMMGNIPQNNSVAEMPVVFTRSDGTEVTVKPTEVIEQVVTNIVEKATTSDGDTEYSVTLTPEDLGTITVKLTKAADGALTVSIAADNARTQRILEESGLALQNSLRQNGIELENWQTVNESQQEARAQDYSGSSKNPYYQEENNSEDGDADDTSFAELISAM